jgi:hypothetical protein
MAWHRISDVDVESRQGTCSVCGPVDVYSGHTNGKQYWSCGPLNRKRTKNRYAVSGSREVDQNYRLLRAYGITLDDFDRMLAEQGGGCARCGKPASDLKVRLSVDHCHKTGVVRKILCVRCNTYLGKLETHRDQLERDLLYLDTGSFEPVDQQLNT